MTRDRDFKQVVRARMAETGESYTAARAAVEQRPAPAPTGGGTAEQAVVDQAAYDAARIEQERLGAAVHRRSSRARPGQAHDPRRGAGWGI